MIPACRESSRRLNPPPPVHRGAFPLLRIINPNIPALGRSCKKSLFSRWQMIDLTGMSRYLSVLLIFFMLAPALSPLARAVTPCGETCAAGQGHHCAHGDECPVHGSKGDKGAAHHGHHDGMDQDGLVCHVSSGDEGGDGASRHSCLSISSCADPETQGVGAPIFGGDYLTVREGFSPGFQTRFNTATLSTDYKDPSPSLFDRPPAF